MTIRSTTLVRPGIYVMAAVATFIGHLDVNAQTSPSAGHTVIKTFPFGAEIDALGFKEGDTIAYDVVARLVAVGGTGTAYIIDQLNGRIVAVSQDGNTRLDFGHTSVDGKPAAPFDVVGLRDGGAAILYSVEQTGTVIRVVSSDGTVLAESRTAPGILPFASSSGTFFLELVGRDTGAIEYSPTLQLVAKYPAQKHYIASVRNSSVGRTVELFGRCWLVPPLSDGVADRFVPYGTAVRYPIGSGVAQIDEDGTRTEWSRPDDVMVLPEVPPDDLLLEDGLLRSTWLNVGTRVGLDGNLYSLVRATDHYELIRWDLTKLPKETFPPISNTPPTIVLDGPTTAKIGQRLIVWIRGRDAEPGRMRFNSSELPTGAELQPKQSGKKAALVWTPTEDQVGEYNIDVTVEDAMCGRATRRLTITVER